MTYSENMSKLHIFRRVFSVMLEGSRFELQGVNFYFGCAANASVDLQEMRSKIARDDV